VNAAAQYAGTRLRRVLPRTVNTVPESGVGRDRLLHGSERGGRVGVREPDINGPEGQHGLLGFGHTRKLPRGVRPLAQTRRGSITERRAPRAPMPLGRRREPTQADLYTGDLQIVNQLRQDVAAWRGAH